MDITDELGSVFIKVQHLEGGPIRETIEEVRQGRFGKEMEFRSGNILSINLTNLRTMAAAWGKETDDWAGKEVELYIGKTVYQGKDHDSVLVRTISPHTAWRTGNRPAGARPRQQELDDDIPF